MQYINKVYYRLDLKGISEICFTKLIFHLFEFIIIIVIIIVLLLLEKLFSE